MCQMCSSCEIAGAAPIDGSFAWSRVTRRTLIRPMASRAITQRVAAAPLIFACTIVSTLAGCQGRNSEILSTPPVAPSPSAVTTISGIGLNGPENIVYDSTADVYLISNTGGGGSARDGNGFISRVDPEGRVVALRWIAGGTDGVELDAPKGLATNGDTLAVADIGALRLFDRRTGSAMGTVELPGLVMNDVAFAADGSIWITDTGPGRGSTPVDTTKDMDAVWRVGPDGRVSAVARGLALDRPDGLVLDGEGAIVSTFGGSRIQRVGGGIPVTSGEWPVVANLPAGRLDGLRRLPDGSLVVTSWDARSVWQLMPGGERRTLLRDVTSPAGVAVDGRRNRLAITSMNDNALYLLPLP